MKIYHEVKPRDRRQKNVQVSFDRRTGIDRRKKQQN